MIFLLTNIKKHGKIKEKNTNGYYFYKYESGVKISVPSPYDVEELEVTGIPYYTSQTSGPNEEFDVPEERITENALRIEQSKKGKIFPRRTGY